MLAPLSSLKKEEGRRVVREMGIGTPMVPELVEGLKIGGVLNPYF
jgi:hypothetical protein